MRTLIGVLAVAGLVWLGVYAYQNYSIPNQAPTAPTVKELPVPFIELAHGAHSKVSNRTNYFITSKEQLLALWKIIDAPGQTPTVDFTQNDVVAVFSGNESTAGHDINVSAVGDSESRMITVVLTQPGASCLSAEVVTSPYQVIELPKTALTLTHEDQQFTTGCLF